MKLLNNKEYNTAEWNKTFQFELTLSELQEIYCVFGDTSKTSRKQIFNSLIPNKECPFDKNDNIFDIIKDVLAQNGGYTYE